MSYDIYLRQLCPACEHDQAGFWVNHTSNTSEIWREAGCNLASYDGGSASMLLIPLRTAIAKIQDAPEAFRKHEPENGWGSVESTLQFLCEIAEACEKFPDAIVEVSY